MKPLTQKYAIIQAFENLSDDYEFTSDSWPLHTTIADTFAVDWTDTLWRNLTAALGSIKPFTVTAGGDDRFGPNGQTKVTLLNPTQELIDLHTTVTGILMATGATFNNPHYNGAGFRPHSTIQKHAHLTEGAFVTFNNLYVVDMFPDGDAQRRKVIRSLPLARTSSLEEK